MSVTKNRGFTIVELIIIIAVIGILAGIVAVAWPNYLKQTHDSERKSDVSQIAAALGVYALQENSRMDAGSGCGKNGDGNGFVSAGTGDIASYQTSIAACLQEVEALPGDLLVDPSGCVYDSGGECGSYGSQPVRAYMKATCQNGGETVTYVMAHLETEPRIDSEVDDLCDADTVAGFTATEQRWGTNYGMNYYVEVK